MAIHDDAKKATNDHSRHQQRRDKFVKDLSHHAIRISAWIIQKIAERALGEIGGIIGGALAAWILHWLCG